MGQAQQGAVGHLLQLRRQGPVQLRPPVAVEVGPEGGDPVQVTVALEVKEVDALAPGDDQELFFPEALHLGEGMPEVLPVPARQGFAVVGRFLPS